MQEQDCYLCHGLGKCISIHSRTDHGTTHIHVAQTTAHICHFTSGLCQLPFPSTTELNTDPVQGCVFDRARGASGHTHPRVDN